MSMTDQEKFDACRKFIAELERIKLPRDSKYSTWDYLGEDPDEYVDDLVYEANKMQALLGDIFDKAWHLNMDLV